MKRAFLAVIALTSAFPAWADEKPRIWTISPQAVVGNLKRQNYHDISEPLRSGRFYQVKAISPHGQSRVNLYIDAHSGRIVDVKKD